jgi:glycosyltransferase involved in cell wall biosynthesis
VSVQICTLNEAANIEECLNAVGANDPEDILVIDGGSTDGTAELARAAGARVIDAGPIGLARQRRVGYQDSPCPYTAFVDADDRLESGWLATMVRELEEGGYAALQSLLRVPMPHNFWTAGWDTYFQETVRPTADTIMVGRPALYRTEALLGISAEPGMIIEDTEMSRDFQLRGLRQGIGTAVSFRHCPDGAGENLAKWRGYGRGYHQFVSAHPDRAGAILTHVLWTIPIVRGWRPVLTGRWQQPAFGLLMAASAAQGFLSSLNSRKGTQVSP